MVLYDTIISPKALSQLDSYVDYILNTLLNPDAAMNLWRDAEDTRALLAKCAGSLKLCTHPKLCALGYHPMFFTRHRYVMLYRIEDHTAYVDGIYHLLQDYENTFARDIDPEST